MNQQTIEYTQHKGMWITPNLLAECADLYSHHYGYWASNAPVRPSEPVRISAKRLREWVRDNDTVLTVARLSEQMIGYAIALRKRVARHGIITWVTQLVVHEDHRNQNVAKTILFSIWGFSDDYAWGLLSANPFAIRALEKATRRRATPARIAKGSSLLLTVGKKCVPYVPANIDCKVTEATSTLNTEFFVDHKDIPDRIAKASIAIPWILGDLEPGWEWLAFTFRDQAPLQLTTEEIELMIQASDDVVRQAYSRMTLDTAHAWTTHTAKEVDFILEHCNLQKGNSALDMGCGNGRHSILLAESGINVLGVDYVSDFVRKAQESAAQQGINTARFKEADCRKLHLDEQFDAIICLYDVIGSFAEPAQNFQIIRNVFSNLRPGGKALISVMNRILTESKAKHYFSLKNEPNRLLELKPSETMETSGDVFNPDYYMIDEDTGVVYRKEQFKLGGELPEELIVRDRRYEPREIFALCAAVGFRVLWTRCVRAGDWESQLDPDHKRAKEILLLCERP